MSVIEVTRDTFDTCMQKPVIEVLTLCTYLNDKVEIIKLRYGSTNTGASPRGTTR